jgi:hypothetical protein
VPTLRRDLKGKLNWSFQATLVASFIVRFLWFFVTLKYGFFDCVQAGLLQFVVAPLSFIVCVLRFCTNGLDCVFHYIINGMVSAALPLVPFEVPTLTLTMDLNFAVIFLTADFFLNCIVYVTSSDAFEVKRFFKHVVYGTLNTKVRLSAVPLIPAMI